MNLANESEQATSQQNGATIVGRLLSAMKLSIAWAIITGLAIGCGAAALWTLIPTALLSWDSSDVNLIGYVSHCPFVPVSSLVLVGGLLFGVVLAVRMRGQNSIGLLIPLAGATGTLLGMLGGIGLNMFRFMGAGIGLGVVLVILIGLVRNSSR